MSAHNIIEFLLTVAAFAVAGLCVGRAVAVHRSLVDVQMGGLLLGFYAIVVSSAMQVVAADNIYLVLLGAFAALVGGLLGALSGAPSDRLSAVRGLTNESPEALSYASCL